MQQVYLTTPLLVSLVCLLVTGCAANVYTTQLLKGVEQETFFAEGGYQYIVDGHDDVAVAVRPEVVTIMDDEYLLVNVVVANESDTPVHIGPDCVVVVGERKGRTREYHHQRCPVAFTDKLIASV